MQYQVQQSDFVLFALEAQQSKTTTEGVVHGDEEKWRRKSVRERVSGFLFGFLLVDEEKSCQKKKRR